LPAGWDRPKDLKANSLPRRSRDRAKQLLDLIKIETKNLPSEPVSGQLAGGYTAPKCVRMDFVTVGGFSNGNRPRWESPSVHKQPFRVIARDNKPELGG
jgi:hypothetical protein